MPLYRHGVALICLPIVPVRAGKEISSMARKALVRIARLMQQVFNETGVAEATSPQILRELYPLMHPPVPLNHPPDNCNSPALPGPPAHSLTNRRAGDWVIRKHKTARVCQPVRTRSPWMRSRHRADPSRSAASLSSPPRSAPGSERGLTSSPHSTPTTIPMRRRWPTQKPLLENRPMR